jgi:hypothetical protein
MQDTSTPFTRALFCVRLLFEARLEPGRRRKKVDTWLDLSSDLQVSARLA